MDLDAIDRGILDLLNRDARHSMRSLARQLGSSTPTVSARVRNLEADGYLRGYHADVAEEALGGRVVWATVQISSTTTEPIAETIAERPWVEEIHSLVGGRMLVRMRLHDDGPTMKDVTNLLTAIAGIASYDVHDVIASRRGGPKPITAKAIRPRCHQCGRAIAADGLTATLGGRKHLFCCVVCRDTFKQRFKKVVERSG